VISSSVPSFVLRCGRHEHRSGLTFALGAHYNVDMQPLGVATVSSSASDCSEQLLEVTPLVWRRIRAEMRRRTMRDLSVPQFNALNFISHHPQASLNVVAEHLGLTAPTTSKLIQKLVSDGVVDRTVAVDRRRICLSLTSSGKAALSLARSETREQLAERLKALSIDELAAVSVALRALGKAFSRGGNNVNVP
jgi:DNA-binding MarR family transcriptional regulator